MSKNAGKIIPHADFDPLEIWKARKRLEPHIYRTPLIHSPGLSEKTGNNIYLKLECWQKCGCFKVRGALNHINSLSEEEKDRGVVTASSGNHALAVAYASSLFGVSKATIFVPENADKLKVQKIKVWGPEIVYQGTTFQEAYEAAQAYTRENDAVFVHSHGDPLVIAGQGTIGLEIIEDMPDMDVVVVPIGGGGLISGISTAVKTIKPDTLIYGVEPEAAPGAYRSLREDKCYEFIDVDESIADGLLGGFGQLPFKICRNTVDETFLVSDDEIVDAMKLIQLEEQLMVEAASSVGLAAINSGKIRVKDKNIVLIITSRNIDAGKFNSLISGS